MATKIEHSMSYPFSTDRFWAVISDEQYWRDLLAAINGEHASFGSFTLAGDTVTVEVTQVIPEDRLPSLVTKVRPGDLEIPRRSVYRRTDSGVVGELEASVSSASATISGTVTTSGDPATGRLDGEVAVGIPFLGGKIEKAIQGELVALFDREREETVTWEETHR